VLISHDHYDHLDHLTVLALADTDVTWLVPLGVGAHLEAWGVEPSRIIELDWWDDAAVGGLRFTCTPARHASGRTPFTQMSTLWAGWAVRGPEHRVFFSGDSALHDDLPRIGDELGPFDLMLIEAGAYSEHWPDNHMGPEQALLAHQLVDGGVLMPVHWGTFNLALHGWTEPMERMVVAAERAGVDVAILRPGASIEPATGATIERWWAADVPWYTAAEAPVWSTSVAHLQSASPLFEAQAAPTDFSLDREAQP